ncbi:MAG: type II secretion system F family protein [Idiomarina sp.]|nr:type II secretion system F family protein [Idiomarina sp.]
MWLAVGMLVCIALSVAFLSLALVRIGRAWLAYAEAHYETKMQDNLTALFLFVPVRQLIVCWCIIASVCLSLVAWIVGSGVVIGGTLLLLSVVPPLIYKYLQRRRQRTFAEQLPDLCMTLANTMRAGGSLHSGLQFLRTYGTGPLVQEIGIFNRQLRLGHSLSEALASLYQRMPSEALERIVMGIEIGQESGGQQAQLLDQIGRALRLQAQLQRRVKSLSSQGRMQGRVMTGLPLFIGTMLWFIERPAMERLFNEALGWGLAALMVILLALGHWFIHRVTAVEVRV